MKKYFRENDFNSDREYLQAIIKKGDCCVLPYRNYSCHTECLICTEHRKLHNEPIHNYRELVSFCKELLKKEDIQLELEFE